jgi:hypothetical protein
MKPQPPYYESRFIRANNADRAQALWLRSTLLLPTAGAPVADAWVMLFDPDGAGNRALKQPYPIDQSDFQYDTWTARIGVPSPATGQRAGTCRSPRVMNAPSSCSPSVVTRRSSRPPRRWCATRWPASTAL